MTFLRRIIKDNAALNHTQLEHAPFNFRSAITPEIFNTLVELFRPPRVGLLHIKVGILVDLKRGDTG